MPDASSPLPHLADPGGMVAPGRTALVVVDVQVDFAAPAGAMGRSGLDLAAVGPAIDRVEALVAAARAAGVAIAFLRVVTRPETDSDALRTWMARRGTPGGEAICRAGEPGSDHYRVAPAPGDMAVAKLGYSGFHGTDLERQLRDRGIDTLVVTGLTTDCCVDSTARDAFQHGFHVFVVSDACAAYGAALHRAALNAMQLNCALLVTAGAVARAWAA